MAKGLSNHQLKPSESGIPDHNCTLVGNHQNCMFMNNLAEIYLEALDIQEYPEFFLT